LELAKVKNPQGVKAFGKHLRVLRETQGLSQQELADIANVEKSTIKRIELATYSPTLDILISVCRALKLKMRDLMDDDSITELDDGM
jgi:DNA-binding XRE family transcriptional regulator